MEWIQQLQGVQSIQRTHEVQMAEVLRLIHLDQEIAINFWIIQLIFHKHIRTLQTYAKCIQKESQQNSRRTKTLASPLAVTSALVTSQE